MKHRYTVTLEGPRYEQSCEQEDFEELERFVDESQENAKSYMFKVVETPMFYMIESPEEFTDWVFKLYEAEMYEDECDSGDYGRVIKVLPYRELVKRFWHEPAHIDNL